MKTKTNYFLIGLFVIGGIVALVAGVLATAAGTFGSRGVMVESYFAESVQGLEKGAVVRLRGVPVGVVTEIKLVSQLYRTKTSYAAVRYRIDPTDVGLDEDALIQRLQQRIDEGFRVRLATQGLTGALYLETDLVTDPKLLSSELKIDWQPEYTHVPSVPSVIARIGSSVEGILGNLERTDLAGLVRDGSEALAQARDAIAALDTSRLRGEVTGLIDASQLTVADLRERAAATFDRVDLLVDDVRGVIEAADPGLLRKVVADLATFAGGLESTRSRIDDVIAAAESALTDVRGEVRGTGRDVDLILAELRRASTHLSGLARTLERYPSLLMIGNPPPRTEPGK